LKLKTSLNTENLHLEKFDIIVEKLDEVHIKIYAEKSIQYELYEFFSFYAPNYKFHPKFKAKIWNGKINLFSLKTNRIYLGLYPRLIKFAKTRNYSIFCKDDLISSDAIVYDESLLSTKYDIREHQKIAIEHALKYRRCVLESPTASGKSYIIFNLIRHINKKTLVIVPSINLVHQMKSDFIDYDNSIEDSIHIITSGASKSIDSNVCISTWQSIYKETESWFKQFDVIFGDEAHGYAATSLISIMEKCKNAEWRIGTTGTVSNQDAKVNELTLEGLFGKIFKVISTKELMDKGYLSQFKIKALILKHKREDSKEVSKMKFQQQNEFLIQHEKRNRFITNLALAQEGNTILLFQYVEKHGKVLHDMIQKKNDGSKNIHFVSGEVAGVDREDIRKICSESNNNIIVASFGTFSVGVNIPSIQNIIFASSYKSKIKVLQSIGRGLRNHESKEIATLYDLVDDCSYGKSKNFSLKHFLERVKIYNQEKFNFKTINVDL